MEIIRKLSRSGRSSRVVVIPTEWIESIKNKTGKDFDKVRLVINDKITVEPYFDAQ